MKKNILVCIITIYLFCSGCATTNQDPATSTSICQPLSAFNTIVVAPINSDSTIVEENKYRHLPKAIALNTAEILKDKLEAARIFNKVIQSSDCEDNAIKIDVTINRLIHHRGSYEVEFGGKIINCQNGESLHIFDDDDEDDDESANLPGQIADNLFDSIEEVNSSCKKH